MPFYALHNFFLSLIVSVKRVNLVSITSLWPEALSLLLDKIDIPKEMFIELITVECSRCQEGIVNMTERLLYSWSLQSSWK